MGIYARLQHASVNCNWDEGATAIIWATAHVPTLFDGTFGATLINQFTASGHGVPRPGPQTHTSEQMAHPRRSITLGTQPRQIESQVLNQADSARSVVQGRGTSSDNPLITPPGRLPRPHIPGGLLFVPRQSHDANRPALRDVHIDIIGFETGHFPFQARYRKD